jgi:ferredoxin-NADP reductase
VSAVLTPRRAIAWRVATVADVVEESAQAVTIVFDAPGWPGHVAGQHVDVRLTAPDGYQAQRSYSIASGPEDGRLALTVERIDDGEVSPYLAGVLQAGDELELRGPIGGHFTWRVEDGGPLLLIAGGSGLVPLMSMLRHRAARDSDVDARLLVSARTLADLLYREELDRLAGGPGLTVHRTLTRERPDGWTGWDRRVDRAMLEAVGPAPAERPRVFLCGPTGFVEQVADALVELGHAPDAIHAERFGPTGG